jgi:hypothetical protein
MKETKTIETMKTLENKNFEISTGIEENKNEDLILTIDIYHKGLKIVCEVAKFEQPNNDNEFYAKRLNEFIAFLAKIENKYNIEELTKIDDISTMFDIIEEGYFKRYLENC